MSVTNQVPTNKLEVELRKLYLQWLAALPDHQNDLAAYLTVFQQSSEALIQQLGGAIAARGVWGESNFPAPTLLPLSPHFGTIYDAMQQAAIQAGIAAGLQATDVARQMLNAGLDTNFRRLTLRARTETVSAYWKNAWDSIADLPDLVMVWGTEHSPRTCPWCLQRDGMVMASPDLRDHPNGRCTPKPTLIKQVEYKGSVNAEGDIFWDPNWAQQLTSKEEGLALQS